MFEFLIIPLLAGICIAITAGSLGTFVIWRRLAYFGDTLSHASLLGLALGFALQINLNIALIASCIIIALLLISLHEKSGMSTDTLLGIIAHSSLSFALVVISFFDDLRIDLMSYLFGDLLSVTSNDLFWISLGCMATSFTLYKLWTPLLAVTISEDMAKVDGYPVKRLNLILMLLIALLIAVAMKFVGALIITSLMIIPAATAKRFSNSPEKMALLASCFGIFSVFGGMALSWHQDTPAGPSVVVMAASLFFLSQLAPQKH